MKKNPGPYLSHEDDFHTRLLEEHWQAVYEETKSDIQRKIDKILGKKEK